MKKYFAYQFLLVTAALLLGVFPVEAQIVFKPAFEAVTMGDAKATQHRIMEYGPNGEFVLVLENGTFYSKGISEEMKSKLEEYLTKDKRMITDIEFTPTGKGWTILAGSKNWTRNVGGGFFAKKNELEKLGIQVVDVEFHPINWPKEKGYSILTSTGKLMEYDIPEKQNQIDFSNQRKKLEASDFKSSKPSSPKRKGKTKITTANYRFSFDWIAVYEVDDGGLGNNKLELYGGGVATPTVIPKGRVLLDTIKTTNQQQMNAFKGEVQAIFEDNYISLPKGDGKKMPNSRDFIIEIDATDYGFDSIEEFEKKAELTVSYRLFEKDSTSGDDEFPLSINILKFSDAHLTPLTLKEVLDARFDSNRSILKLKDGASSVAIAYSFEKIKN